MTATTLAGAPGLRARLGRFSSQHRSITVIVGMSIVTVLLLLLPYVPPFSLFQPQKVDRKSTRLNSSNVALSRMPSSA